SSSAGEIGEGVGEVESGGCGGDGEGDGEGFEKGGIGGIIVVVIVGGRGRRREVAFEGRRSSDLVVVTAVTRGRV
ncbi:hypothetical protein A2U01_0042729, partial [Trifolium medium]|nr:hypothetical protein [Trifolium medium]